MLTLVLAFLLNDAHAFDLDGDGYDSSLPPIDCRDAFPSVDPLAATINPAAAEDGVDATDEDCDGSASIRREFVTSFDNLSIMTGDMNLLNASQPHSGVVRLSPTSTGAASARLKGAMDFESGDLTVVVDVDRLWGG